MRELATRSTAGHYLKKFGISAKLEVTRKMLAAAADGDDPQREFFRHVLLRLVEIEAGEQPNYDAVLGDRESVADLLVAALKRINEQFVLSSDADKRNCGRLCDISATYIVALENALVTMVREGDVGRPGALRVLRDGPPAWRDPGWDQIP